MVNYGLRKRDEFLDVITLWPSRVYAGIFASSRRDSHGTPVGIFLGMPVSKFLPGCQRDIGRDPRPDKNEQTKLNEIRFRR